MHQIIFPDCIQYTRITMVKKNNASEDEIEQFEQIEQVEQVEEKKPARIIGFTREQLDTLSADELVEIRRQRLAKARETRKTQIANNPEAHRAKRMQVMGRIADERAMARLGLSHDEYLALVLARELKKDIKPPKSSRKPAPIAEEADSDTEAESPPPTTRARKPAPVRPISVKLESPESDKPAAVSVKPAIKKPAVPRRAF